MKQLECYGWIEYTDETGTTTEYFWSDEFDNR